MYLTEKSFHAISISQSNAAAAAYAEMYLIENAYGCPFVMQIFNLNPRDDTARTKKKQKYMNI